MAAAAIVKTDAPVHARTLRAESAAAPDEWVGTSAPEFNLSTLDGHKIRLSDFRGKVVLLNFWATWCAPCRVETPWLVGFYRRYRAQGLEVVGISMDDGNREKIANFVRSSTVSYTTLLKDDQVVRAYGGLRFLPQTFFVGRDGKILARTFGMRSKSDYEAEIRRALAARSPSG